MIERWMRMNVRASRSCSSSWMVLRTMCVAMMRVYLGDDPAKGGKMDFEGMMAGYSHRQRVSCLVALGVP